MVVFWDGKEKVRRHKQMRRCELSVVCHTWPRGGALAHAWLPCHRIFEKKRSISIELIHYFRSLLAWGVCLTPADPQLRCSFTWLLRISRFLRVDALRIIPPASQDRRRKELHGVKHENIFILMMQSRNVSCWCSFCRKEIINSCTLAQNTPGITQFTITRLWGHII